MYYFIRKQRFIVNVIIYQYIVLISNFYIILRTSVQILLSRKYTFTVMKIINIYKSLRCNQNFK